MNARNKACKVSANAIGLPPSCYLENVRLFDHLTPLVQQLLADSKEFLKRNGFKFCWAKSFIKFCDKQHQPPIVNYMPATRQWETQNSMFGTLVDFFSRLLRAQNVVLSRVKLYRNDLRGNTNYFELAGGSRYRGFELPRVKLQ